MGILKCSPNSSNGRCYQKTDCRLSPALCWIGGKTKLKNTILERIPEHKTYVEGFVGGASIFFAKPLAERNIINDKDSDLIWFYRNLRDTKCGKLQECRLPSNKKQFDKKVFEKRKNICNYLGVNKISYGCKMGKPSFSRSKAMDFERGKSGIIKLKKSCDKYQEKLRKTKIMNKDYRKVFRKYDSKDTFTYLDPPYVDTYGYWLDDYGSDIVNPQDVCGLAKKAKGDVMISYNNHPSVRRACKGLRVSKVKTKYELQKSSTGNSKEVSELLITNFKPGGKK